VRREVEHGVFLLGVSREVIQGGICCEYSGRSVSVLRSCGTQRGDWRTRDDPAADVACSCSRRKDSVLYPSFLNFKTCIFSSSSDYLDESMM
jgi:hypothetical protein